MSKGYKVVNKRTLLILAILSFLIAFLLMWFGLRPASAKDDRCAFLDNFIGGQRFAYSVDGSGNWNLPPDAEPLTTVTFQKTGIWEYYSRHENAKYFIVFLTWEPSGNPFGQHDICVWKVNTDD